MAPSRRSFFGLLAGLPLIAPAIARSVAGPRYISGIAGEVPLSPLTNADDVGELILSRRESRAFELSLTTPRGPNPQLVELMRSRPPWQVPNRLFGARVNDEGNAV